MLGLGSLQCYRLFLRLRAKGFSALARGGFAALGSGSVIQLPVRLRGERRISIGKDVFIGAGSWLQVEGEEEGAVALTIGDGTSVAGACVFSAAESVRIGRRVLFARNVYVSDHIHAYGDATRAVLDQGIDRVEPVEIHDGAWLGQNVVVCPGVRIGAGAVVGANAVVVDDVPAHSLAVGVPAAVVRQFSATAESAS